MIISNLKVLLTIFLLWITTQFSFEYENYIACIMVLSFGILHGSNDLKIIQKTSEKFNFVKTISIYLLTIIITLLAFLIWPSLFLLLFVVFSSYHFGEQHLCHKVKNTSLLVNFLKTSYGLVIFFMIFFMHAGEVILILEEITQLELTSNLFKYALILFILITFVLFIMLKNKQVLEINIVEEALLLILFLVIFSNATLLWSFSIYFIVWHSLPSLKDQLLLLYGNINKRSIVNYLKSSFIYWFIAIIGIVLLVYIFSENDYDFYTFSAALLFSITFPHIIVISKIYK